MIRVSVLYPRSEGSKFDFKYYGEKHMALVKARLTEHGLLRIEVDKGIGGAEGSPAPLCLYRALVLQFRARYSERTGSPRPGTDKRRSKLH